MMNDVIRTIIQVRVQLFNQKCNDWHALLIPNMVTLCQMPNHSAKNLRITIIYLLPERASEQGNVIGSVHIYIYICVYKKNCN